MCFPGRPADAGARAQPHPGSRFARGVLALVLAPALLFGCDRPESAPEAAPEGGSAILERITRPIDGGQVHLVRLVQRGDRYAFEPSDLTIAPGDVVRFVTTGTQPESVRFDSGATDPAVAAYVREQGLDRGVLLTEPGAAHDAPFPAAPPGDYPFESIPHAARGMRGTIRVVAP